jgi:hypothetical protein
MNTHKLTLALLSGFCAAPAFACGGPELGDFQLRVLTASMITAPILAALLVDRGAFALAACALNLKRLHRPSIAGPLLAFVAVVVALGSVAGRDIELAIGGFALVPVAAMICAVSFARSVIVDMRGQAGPQLLRVFAVAAFVAIALLRTFT